jgi:hypothetical protein
LIIQVAGLDPSFRNWGIAEATLDLETGVLDTPNLSVIKTAEEPKGKQVRQNSYDLVASSELAGAMSLLVPTVKIFFVEVPHGSQSASSMKGYGVCIGILGYMRATGATIIEVSESESKKLFVGKRTATKEEMINRAVELYPDANWPRRGGKIVAGTAEHMADAIAAIHSGVNTPEFTNLMKLLIKHC